MMLKYELKKIFSKRINQVLLAAVLVVTIIYSGMAIGSMSYTDEEGQDHTGIEAGRLLAEDKNQWKGDLTPEVISQVIKDYKELSAKYPDGLPDEEWGKQVQSYYDIYSFVIDVMTPDSEWNESVVYQLSDEQLQDIYTIYQDNMKNMAEEYGTTPEKRSYLDFLFNRMGARRIYAYVEDDNLSSQHLCQKLGMRLEGIFKEFVSFINQPDGSPLYENTMQFAILKKEWENQNIAGSEISL